MSLELSAGRQYDAVYRARDVVVALFFIGSDILTYSLFHDIMRVAITALHVGMMVFSDTRQPMRLQLVWQSLFIVYFAFHTAFGAAINEDTAANQVLRCVLLMAQLNVLICMIMSEDGLRKFMNIYVAVTLVKTAVVFLTQGGELGNARLGEIVIPLPVLGLVQYNANGFGMSCALCILFQMYLFDGEKKEWWRFAFMAVNAITILLTGSRKSLMLIVMFTFIFQFFNKPHHRLRTILLTGGLCTLGLVLILNVESLYKVIGYRFINLMQSFVGGELEEGSAISRNKMINAAVYWLEMRPFTGYGLNNFQYLSGSYGTYSHNNYTELMVSGGIQTLLLYYWFYVYLIFQNLVHYTKERKVRALSLCLAIILPIIEYGWVTYSAGLAMVYLAVACAFPARLNHEKRQAERSVWWV